MKRVLALFLLILLLALPVSASAPLLVDDAQLLSDTEAAAVLEILTATTEELGMDVVVVTVDSLDGMSAMAYADDYYDYHDYSPDGVLLLVAMGEREWHITTSGAALSLVTNAEAEQIGDALVPYLSEGNYEMAFITFAEQVHYLATVEVNEDETEHEHGHDYNYYDYDYDVRVGKDPQGFLICLLIGIVIGLIAVLIMKGQLKSVRSQNAAGNYVVPGSFGLTESHDLFLYRNLNRRPISQDNGSSGHGSGGIHVGSSGRSHGGAGGRF